MTNPKDGLGKAIDEAFGWAGTAKLRCSRCNGKAVIDPESIFDNRSKKVLRCLECDFTEDLDRLKQGK